MGKKSYLHRGRSRVEREMDAAGAAYDQELARDTPPPSDAAPDTMLSELGKLPLYTYVSAQPGPQGGRDLWVSVQLNHGMMAAAFALHPAMVENWLRATGRDMRAMAAQLRHHNTGLTVVEAGAAMPKRELWTPGSSR